MLILKFWLSAYIAAAIYNLLFFRYMDKVVYGKYFPLNRRVVIWFLKTLLHPVRLFGTFYGNIMMPELLIAREREKAQARYRRVKWEKKVREGN